MVARLTVALVVFLASAAMAMAAPREVSVADLLAKPMQSPNQPLRTVGLVQNGLWGPKLCALPEQRRGLKETDACVDLEGPALPFSWGDERYTGAVVAVEGYFSHSCFAEVSEGSEVEAVLVVCIHRGRNGWFSAVSARIVGTVAEPLATSCGEPSCYPFEEIALDSPKAAGLDGFARRVAATWRAGDEQQMLSLMLPSLRPEILWYLRAGDKAVARKFLRTEFRHAARSVSEPGAGYRLFEVKAADDLPAYEQLCFCISGDCAGFWQRPFDRRFALQRNPIRCFDVWRGTDGWTVLF